MSTNAFRETGDSFIPADWRSSLLGTVLEQHRESYKPAQSAVVPYIGLEHIISGDPRLHEHASSEKVKSAKTYFYPEQILYGKLRLYLDKCVLVDFEGICSTDILVFDAVRDLAIPAFVTFLLHTDRFIKLATDTMTGVNHPRTHWNSLQKFEFALPPLPERRRIAAVLNAIQDEIAAQDHLFNALREFKRSVMARLFTYGAGEAPAETKTTEVGEIPVGWEVRTIAEVAKISGGGTPSTKVPGFLGRQHTLADIFRCHIAPRAIH